MRPSSGPYADLSALEVASALNYVQGGVWTRERLHEAGYSLPSRMCPLCEKWLDTMEHRLWECEATSELRRQFTRTDKLLLRDQDDVVASGWVEAPSEVPPTAEVEWSSDRFEVLEEVGQSDELSTIFVDGSCNTPHHPSFRTASWSVAFYDKEEDYIGSLGGPVWAPVKQTAGAGEMMSVSAGLEVSAFGSQPGAMLWSDYATAVTAGQYTAAMAMESGRLFAGIMRNWWSSQLLHKQGPMPIKKVAAHTGGSDFVSKGNDKADTTAKKFAIKLADQRRSEQKTHHSRTQLAIKMVRLAGQALALFPRLKQPKEAKHKRRRGEAEEAQEEDQEEDEQRPNTVIIAHDWYAAGRGYWRCAQCGRGAVTDPALQDDLSRGECEGGGPFRIQHKGGHKLWVAGVVDSPGSVVIICGSCGQRTSGRDSRVTFEEVCPGTVAGHPGREDSLKRFWSGRHPDRRVGAQLSPPVVWEPDPEDETAV